jgi:uncharacterized oligopeptide transporter (OPT) family protein
MPPPPQQFEPGTGQVLGRSAFTWRSALVGLGLGTVVATYSTYAGLKVGGVYWPILTATLMSMALLKATGGASRQAVSVAATAASTGGLLAAGILFTLPAGKLLGLAIRPAEVTLVAVAGGLLGVLFTLPLREEMIERLALPYPDGTAAARMIEAGDEGGGKARTLLAACGAAGLFTVLRDGVRLLPGAVNLETLGATDAARRFSFGSAVSLVPLAGGFLIGPRFTGAWFAGAVASYLVAVPALVAGGRHPDKGAAIAALTRPVGIGVIVGASFAYFLLRGLPSLRPLLGRLARASARQAGGWAAAVVAAVAGVSLALALPLWLTLLAVVGTLVVAYIAARIAGELNIDPMEIFAIALLLAVLFFVELPPRSAVVFAALLCLAAGMAGDFLQDLRAGYLLGTRPSDQAKAQLLAVVVTAPVVALALEALLARWELGSAELPAPQAVALAGIVRAGEIESPLAWGAAAGAALTVASLLFRQGLLPVAFGIGLYAPIELSFPLFVGGLLRWAAERRGVVEPARLVAAGLIAGEGFVGVALALAGLLI